MIRDLERDLQDLHDELEELVRKERLRSTPKGRQRVARLREEIATLTDALRRARGARS
jgi:hypothetical protein